MASSAAAFVEGGIQDACEDACSICLETFTDADPAVVTCCRHEYHLQCIIEWSQRSKECPMCWQALSLKDPDSQELLAAVEHERAIRQSRINVAGVFPPEGYEFHRLAAYGDDSDFEERMMRHLAFVTMGRRQLGRRDGSNPVGIRPGYGNLQSQFVIVPAAHGNTPGATGLSTGVTTGLPTTGLTTGVPAGNLPLSPAPASLLTPTHQALQGSPATPESGSSSVDSVNSRSRGSPRVSDGSSRRSSPDSSHTFSESLKSRLAAASSRYKESLTKTTKSFRDRFRMRNGTTMADIGARAREVSAGVVRALERISLENQEKDELQGSAAEANSSPAAAAAGAPESNPVNQIETTPVVASSRSQQENLNSSSNNNTNSSNNISNISSTTTTVHSGSSKIVPQSLTDEAENSLEIERTAPAKSIEGSTGPALEGQQMHLVPMST